MRDPRIVGVQLPFLGEVIDARVIPIVAPTQKEVGHVCAFEAVWVGAWIRVEDDAGGFEDHRAPMLQGIHDDIVMVRKRHEAFIEWPDGIEDGTTRQHHMKLDHGCWFTLQFIFHIDEALLHVSRYKMIARFAIHNFKTGNFVELNFVS